jgi:ubiquitin C-terminal hydrolase
VLILRLQRLDEHGQNVATQVQLDPGLTFTSTEGAKLEYPLYGVVEHVSAGSEQGHYVAYVKVGPKPLRQYVCERFYHRYIITGKARRVVPDRG